MLGFEFDNNSEPFSVYNILQCITCAVFQIVQIAVYEQNGYLIYALLVGLIGIACCANTLRFKFREHERKDIIDLNRLVAHDQTEVADYKFFDK